jgi:hypothetical protein
MNPSRSGPARVYFLSPWRRGILLALWALLVLPLVAIGVWGHDPAALFVGLLAGLILAVIFIAAAWRFPRLALGEAGVIQHNLGYRLATSWDNIAELRRTRGSQGFVLRRPMDDAGARRYARSAAVLRIAPGVFRLYPPEVLQLITERRYIPIEAFAYWLTHGDLEREIARRAPWLARPLAGASPNPYG